MQSIETKTSYLTEAEKRLIFLSILILIVAPFASDSYTPSMPAITKAFAVSTLQMQYTMTAYLTAVALSQLVYGPLSDRFGRKPIILTGLVITLAGSLVCALANSIDILLLGRFIQGSGAGVSNSIFRALLRDRFTGKKMSLAGSYAGMFYTVAFSSAPIVGGYIQHFFGWRANFIFVAIIIAIIVMTLLLRLPETHLQPDSTATRFRNIFKNYFSLLCNFHFLGYAIISGIAFSGLVAYYTAGPFLLENRLHLSPVQFGWVSIGLGAGIFIGQYLNAKLVIRVGTASLLILGIVLMVASSVLMLLAGLLGIFNTYVVVIPIVVYSIAAGLVFSNAMAEAFHGIGNIAGIAGAMYGCVQIVPSSFTSFLVAQVPETTQVPLAIILTIFALVAIILLILLKRKYGSIEL